MPMWPGAPATTRCALAEEFSEEEAGHAAEIQELFKHYPEPEEHWDEDLDPPRSID
jgi:hypothetical protein